MSSLALLASLLLAGAHGKPAAAHPDVGENPSPDACESCHLDATPEVESAWEEGRHGLLLVRCVVCHGSTGKDFVRTPAPGRCAGCHAAEVASLAPAKGAKRKGPPPSCFACHDPHRLTAAGKESPHAR